MTTPVAGRQSPSCVWWLAIGLIVLMNNCDQVKQEESTFGQQNNNNTIKWSAQQADAAPDRQQISTESEPAPQDNELPTPIGDPKLELRLDKLEFEQRKLAHQLKQGSSGANNEGQQQQQANEAKWISLSARLEHMENFITITTKKLYETEQRVKQLEKCECRLSCRWMPTASLDTSSEPTNGSSDERHEFNQSNGTIQIKADGETWQHNCDVCSCHRGKVRCRHMSCPEVHCANPHHQAGKCCPVCYKPCVYKSQTIRHGNKLVINSNPDTCKECICMDGRFKCQRVEQANWKQRQQRRSILNHSQASNKLQFEQTPIAIDPPIEPLELESDEDDELELDELLVNEQVNLKQQRGRRDSFGRQQRANIEPLVCPQIDCKIEHQIRFQNDCCTYCKGYDFCKHKAYHECHPNAFCINAPQSSMMNQSYTTEQQKATNLSSMFSCHCRPGFVGDGRFTCRDIDECLDKRLNECDSKSSTCINLPGSYECACKRGFRFPNNTDQPAATPTSGQDSQIAVNATSGLLRTATPSSGNPYPPARSCVDVNECADGKLNRCHPQAKCVNLRGSYKCRCRHGFLGNGFECHKWFSSNPNSAAYLYRHAQDNKNNNSRAAVHLPLATLTDPDEDEPADGQRGVATQRTDGEEEDEDEDEEDEEGDQEDEERNYSSTTQDKPPDMNNAAKWEPLRLESPQQLDANQTVLTNNPDSNKQAEDNKRAENYPQSMALNTRTMFFQPPPMKLWQHDENVTDRSTDTTNTTTTTTHNTSTHTTILVSGGDRLQNNNGANLGASDTNDPLYIQRSSETVYQNDPRLTTTTSGSQITSLLKSNGDSVPAQLGSVTSSNLAKGGAGYKRGTIIASATTSPARGHTNRVAHISSTQYQRSKALGVTSSSAPTSINHHDKINLANVTCKIGQFIPLIMFSYLYYIHFNHDVTFYFI